MSRKRNDKALLFTTTIRLEPEDLHDMVMRNGRDQMIRHIVAMDLACEDWGVTEELIAHFKALEVVFHRENPGEAPIAPKKIEL